MTGITKVKLNENEASSPKPWLGRFQQTPPLQPHSVGQECQQSKSQHFKATVSTIATFVAAWFTNA